MNHVTLNQDVGIEKNKCHKKGLEEINKPKGKFFVEHIRDGKVLDTYELTNDVVDEGAIAMLNIMFNSGTQLTNWYLGLISAASYSALSNNDTAASHAGWIEFTNYDETTRVAWGNSTTSTRTVTNASAAVFTISATGTVKGIFLISNSTKSGTSGKLWATALFPSGDVAVVDNDVLRITYNVSN